MPVTALKPLSTIVFVPYETLRDALIAIADEFPDKEFIDPTTKLPADLTEVTNAPGCIYTNADGEPCCIIGVLADRLGFERPSYEDQGNNGKTIGTVIRGWIATSYTAKVERLLTETQRLQDRGFTWREAVARGIRLAEDPNDQVYP
jgi:hypothetical protein